MTPPGDRGPTVAPTDARLRSPGISPAVWIPTVYAVASIAWIAISDRFVADVAGPAQAQALWSTVKGVGFVAVTSFLLVVGLRWALGRERTLALRVAETEDFLRALMENSTDVTLVIDAKGVVTFVSPAVHGLLGFAPSEVVGRPSSELILPEDRARAAATLDALIEGRETVQRQELRLRRANGGWATVESRRTAMLDHPVIRGIVVNCRDITERKQAEAAVRSSEALLRAIANSSPDSIFAKDREGRWTFANTAALQVAGKPAEEVLGRTDEEIIGDRLLASALTTNDREVLATGTARSFEEVIVSPAGRRLFVSTKAPLRDPEGRVVGIAGVAKDVTEIRKLQEQLAVTSRLAAMGTLVAGVSHEVNNPLAGVLAGSGMATEDVKEARRLLDESTPESAAEVARRLDEALDSLADVRSGSQRIAQIVKDLSLFARPNPQRTRVRIAQVVDQAMRWLPVSVGTAATIRVEDHGAPDVLASFGQLGQVLVNLVTNAAKATPRGRKGEVVVRLGPGGSGMARLEVIDNGVGMAPNVIERIFDPFFTTRSAGEGTGLGLPIIHAIVTAHGGTISVESEVGKGSTFRVELPAAPAEA